MKNLRTASKMVTSDEGQEVVIWGEICGRICTCAPLYVLELERIMISGDEHVAPELFPRTFSCGHHLYLNVNKIAF